MNCRFVMFMILFSFIGNFIGGYFSAVTNLPQQQIYNFVNESLSSSHHIISTPALSNAWVSVIVSTYNLGEFGGLLISGFLADKYGRRMAVFIFAGAFLLLGCVTMLLSKLSNYFELLIIGRFIVGCHFGIRRSIVFTYLFECSFPHDRSFMGTIAKTTAGLGMAVGQALGFPQLLGNRSYWPVLLAVPGLMIALASFLFYGLVPESPKFLYVVSENREKARKAAKKLYGSDKTADDLIQLIEKEEQFIKPVSIVRMFKDRTLRYCSLLCFILHNERSILGTTSLLLTFSTYIFISLGVSEMTAKSLSFMYTMIGEFGVICSLLVVKRVKRRTLFFGTAWPIVFIYVLVSIFGAFNVVWAKYICVVLLFSSNFFYAFGCGIMLHVVATEILPLEIRATAGAMGVAVSQITTFLARIIIFNIYAKIGTYAFLILVVLNTIALVFLHFRMPETKDKRLDEIVNEIEWKANKGEWHLFDRQIKKYKNYNSIKEDTPVDIDEEQLMRNGRARARASSLLYGKAGSEINDAKALSEISF